MSEQLTLPVIAAVLLVWYLVVSVRQWHTDRSAKPTLLWREARFSGWTEWQELTTGTPSADDSTVLSAVRANAAPDSTAVQFATVVHPADAPAYTLRVLYMSAVREPGRGMTG